ncbi:MAG: enoyl-CoA hydratase/isomerase family protein [Actinomycetota bacterium]
MSDIVQYEKRGRIGIITLNRPEALNAVDGDVAAGVEAAIDQIEADEEVWVAVLTANTAGQEKPVFCAGADLKAINSGDAAALNTKRAVRQGVRP